MMTLEDKILEHPFLKTLPPEDSERLLKNAYEIEFKNREVLFCDGEPANRLFLIQSGKVALETGDGQNKTAIEVIQPGGVLGWSWLFPPFSWHFLARALEGTHVVVLDGAHLLVECEENPAFGYRLMKRIAQVLIHRIESQKVLQSSES